MGILHGPTRPYPADSSLPELFAEQVRARPDAVALVEGKLSYTYAELDERTNRLAHLLRDRGVSPGTRVGVLLERGHELVMAVLAVLKAGGAYVPINPAYPRERQQGMLADVQASVVVTREELRLAEAADAPPPAPPAVVDSRALALVLFTSGSTGRPKGVMIEHRSVLRLVFGTDYIDLGPDERIAQAADMSFDVFTFEVWASLLHGGTLCVIPSEEILTPGRLATALATHRITTLFLTSALFSQVMADRPDTFAGLKNLLVGGDVVNVSWARKLAASGPATRPARFLNAYGPAETTTFAACGLIESLPKDASSVPIGKPIANTSCYVLDADLSPVAAGATGELYIGGPGVARGYAEQPEQTQERFLPDPFLEEEGARMYRTGDVVRYREDGLLEYLGRVDHQVKIRGYRVEPGEVEAILSLHPDVGHLAVIADGPVGERRLVAHVVPAVAGTTPSGMREFLATRLPDWMIPSAFVVSPELPLTGNGKVDRAALPPVPQGSPDAGAVPPRTDLERQLAALTADMLGLASVGVTDDFFALGGHSLLAMRLVSRINDRFSVQIALGDFLYDPTVGRLAAEVSRGQ